MLDCTYAVFLAFLVCADSYLRLLYLSSLAEVMINVKVSFTAGVDYIS